MANWRHKIQLNEVLAELDERFDFSRLEEDCPQEVKQTIADEVQKAFPLARFAKQILAAKSIAALDRVLEKVFDAADRELVWCGFSTPRKPTSTETES